MNGVIRRESGERSNVVCIYGGASVSEFII